MLPLQSGLHWQFNGREHSIPVGQIFKVIYAIYRLRLSSSSVSYFRYIPAAISIKHLLDHGKTANQLGFFMFLKKEIPTRLANMIKELQLLPSDLKKQKECSQILNDYISSFR